MDQEPQGLSNEAGPINRCRSVIHPFAIGELSKENSIEVADDELEYVW